MSSNLGAPRFGANMSFPLQSKYVKHCPHLEAPPPDADETEWQGLSGTLAENGELTVESVPGNNEDTLDLKNAPAEKLDAFYGDVKHVVNSISGLSAERKNVHKLEARLDKLPEKSDKKDEQERKLLKAKRALKIADARAGLMMTQVNKTFDAERPFEGRWSDRDESLEHC